MKITGAIIVTTIFQRKMEKWVHERGFDDL
jgi:hypothetical protein